MEHTHSKQTNLTLAPVSKAERAAFWRLYRTAFPRAERKPALFLSYLVQKGVVEALSIRDGARFVGLAVTAQSGELALLDYFAILPSLRGSGYGAAALELLIERYANKRLFLEIERPDTNAANNRQRVRRKAFYLRNGISESGVYAHVYGVDMELLQSGEPVSYAEYHAFLLRTFGRVYCRAVRPQQAKAGR